MIIKDIEFKLNNKLVAIVATAKMPFCEVQMKRMPKLL